MQSFFSHFSELTGTQSAVAKLREFILQLAVRGKLIPQNSADEPASNQLKHLFDKRAHLLLHRKIRKIQEIETLIPHKSTCDLPSSWVVEWLGNIAETITKGSTPTTYGHAFQGDGIRFIKVENVKKGRILSESIQDFISEEAHQSQGRSQLQLGDVLFSIAGTIGETCVVTKDDLPANTNQALAIIRGTDVVFRPQFLKLQLDSFVANAVRARARGGAMNNISLGDLKSLLVFIPPLKEQDRIIKKVDELMRLCDNLEVSLLEKCKSRMQLNSAALGSLNKAASLAPEEFKQAASRLAEHFDTLYDSASTVGKLRSTILQLAVQGKLVAQDPNDERAESLMERVYEKRKRLIKDGKLYNKNSFPDIADHEKEFKLPDSWCWVRLGSIVDQRLGKMLDKSKNKGVLYPYLRNTNVQWLRFDLSDVKEMKFEKNELEEYKVRVGDLLICEGGEPGRCAIWEGEIAHIMFQKAIHRVRPFCGINSWFLLYRLLSDAMTGNLNKHFTGATIKHFTGQELSRYVIGLPPLEEQTRIVAKVNQLMALCDDLEAKLQQVETHSEKLMKAAVQHVLQTLSSAARVNDVLNVANS